MRAVFAVSGAERQPIGGNQILCASRVVLSRDMADTPSPLSRIDAAITRIQATIHSRALATEQLAERHDALREKIAQAIGAIDEMIESER